MTWCQCLHPSLSSVDLVHLNALIESATVMSLSCCCRTQRSLISLGPSSFRPRKPEEREASIPSSLCLRHLVYINAPTAQHQAYTNQPTHPSTPITMPRQSRGPAPRPAASRPTAAPQPRPAAPQQQQTRQASTAAHPPQQQQAPPQANAGSQGSGLFGQMASTAA